MATDSGYDLVVIGMGAAGLSAAVGYLDAASAEGRAGRVAVLERASEEGRGGATRWTGSWLRIMEDRRLDPEFIGLMERHSRGLADLEYCSVLEAETPKSVRFLEEHGVEVPYVPLPFPTGGAHPGLGMPVGGGKSIVDSLSSIVDQGESAEILYQSEAVRLSISSEGRVNGVMVRGRDGLLRTIQAGAVVIACGGFEGNPELLTQYVGTNACDLPVIAPTLRNNRGDGLKMALEVGADTAGQFDMFHGEPVDPRTNKPDAVIYGFAYGVVVNKDAERFFDEGQNSFDATFELLGYEIWRNQEQTAFWIGDQTTLSVPYFETIQLSDLPPIESDTLAELAEKLGLDRAVLEATIAEYNAACRPGEFNPAICDGKATAGLEPPKSNWAFPLESPPFVAYPLTCAITFTFGGIRTDTQARVVTPTGTPIPGLYAAGEVTGLYYHEYPAGTSVLRSVTFGRIAGGHAAVTTSQTGAAAGAGG
jgi:succinate dehydrogenase/fumarate reductase flavoprotein subunit